MVVSIRLRRMGAKGYPFYRIVVADSRRKRDGRFIEILGHFDPMTEPPKVEVDEDRAMYWLSVGAQPSDTVRRLFSKKGFMTKHHEAKQK
ncbi:MAG: 30S ribosomal protein S16 [bacterium]|nr:30S ribosomal protein S16 [bacterium]